MRNELPASMSVVSILHGLAQEIGRCSEIVRKLEAEVLLPHNQTRQPMSVQAMQDFDLLTQALEDLSGLCRRIGQGCEPSPVIPVRAALLQMRLFDLQQRIAGMESPVTQQDNCALLF